VKALAIGGVSGVGAEYTMGTEEGDLVDPEWPDDLSPAERTRFWALAKTALMFATVNNDLYGPVFETNLFQGKKPFDRSIVTGDPIFNKAAFPEDPSAVVFPELVDQGYVPVATRYAPFTIASRKGPLPQSTAALLAMEAVKMTIPRTRRCRPQEILEARHKLRDHLPPFWSAMLKLTATVKSAELENLAPIEVILEARNVVDSVVRPALIDLSQKLTREKKDWAYKILNPIQKAVRLLIGNPPLTQQQLITTAVTLGADVAVSAAENLRAIDQMKREAGLTFLLESSKIFERAAG
jgi:hypothetical protein